MQHYGIVRTMNQGEKPAYGEAKRTDLSRPRTGSHIHESYVKNESIKIRIVPRPLVFSRSVSQ